MSAPRSRAGATPPLRHGVPGVLGVIAVLFISTGLVRIGLGAAGAQGAFVPAAADASGAPTESAHGATDPLDLLESLRAREARIERLEAAIEARLQAVAAAENELERSLSEMAEVQARLADTLALSDQAAERDIAALTAVFENMKPRDSAVLFEEMDIGFAAGFIGRLRPEIAAEVMAGLNPRTAYGISAVLAGRNARVPTE